MRVAAGVRVTPLLAGVRALAAAAGKYTLQVQHEEEDGAEPWTQRETPS